MDEHKLVEYLVDYANDENTDPEVLRFIEDLLIKIEFGHFDEDETDDE